MKHLQKTANEISTTNTQLEKIELLSKAFEMFSFETSRLETAYAALKEQFKELNLELQETNGKLHNKVGELDLITNYLKSILDNINQGILFIDLNGIITTFSKAAESILGHNSAQILFNSFWQHFNDESFGFSMRDALASRQSQGTAWTEYHAQNGHHAELEVSAEFIHHGVAADDGSSGAVLPGGQTPALGILLMVRDVTEMRRLQLMANRSDRMKALGEMAAQMAHEIRNPLGGIKGFASLLKRDLSDNPQMEQMAGYIIEGTDNLNKLVTQVLDYARPHHPHFEKVDLIVLLKEMRQLVLADQDINKDNVDISLETELDSAWLLLDQHLFKSALLNLIVNAIQAMPEGGRLVFGVKQQRSNIVLTVSDTGSGIEAENMGKLFSPFFTTKPEGNGFGLAEVLKVIQEHEGTIDVLSTVNKGTSFIIKLPVKLH